MSAGIIIAGIIVGILILWILITLHELAHFIVAKLSGAYVYEFAIGLGPKVFQWKRKETQYTLRALPFGGYVHIASEMQDPPEGREDEVIEDKRYMENISRWKKMLFIISGALFNLIIAITILTSLYAIAGYKPNDPDIYGATYLKDKSAYNAIQEIKKEPKYNYDNRYFVIQNYIIKNKTTGKEYKSHFNSKLPTFRVVVISFIKDLKNIKSIKNEEVNFTFFISNYNIPVTKQVWTPLTTYKGKPAVGIAAPNRYFKNSGDAYLYGWKDSFVQSGYILKNFGKLFTGQWQDLSGPVGIVKEFSQLINSGPVSFFFYVALLSANLFILNLIPIPPLDGYKFWENIVEVAIRREVSHKTKIILNSIGAILFISLFLGITLKDIIF